MEEYKDCLSCRNSFSNDNEDGEHVLYCTKHDKDVTEDEEACDDFN